MGLEVMPCWVGLGLSREGLRLQLSFRSSHPSAFRKKSGFSLVAIVVVARW